MKRKMSGKEQACWSRYAEKLNKYRIKGSNAEWHLRRAQELTHSLRSLFASQIIFSLRFASRGYSLDGLKLLEVTSVYVDDCLDVIGRHGVRLAPQGDGSEAAKPKYEVWQVRQVIFAFLA